jgi:F-type H+-transporting ATPase subunit b
VSGENCRRKTRRTVRCQAWVARISVAILIGGLLLALTGPVCWAAGGGEEGEREAHHEVHFGKEMVFQIINFALLVCLLVYVYRKNSAGAFEKRSLEVQTAMEEAAKAKKDAEDKYLEYQARIAQLDEEITKILDLSKEDAEKEKASILEEAQRQSEKIVQQAELTAKHEVVLAKHELRKEAAELAAGMAAEAMKQAMTPEDQRKWVQAYIDKIGEVQ